MRLYLLFLYFLKTPYQLLAFVGINLRNDVHMLGYFERILTYFMALFGIKMERLIWLIKNVLSKCNRFFDLDMNQDILEYSARI